MCLGSNDVQSGLLEDKPNIVYTSSVNCGAKYSLIGSGFILQRHRIKGS